MSLLNTRPSLLQLFKRMLQLCFSVSTETFLFWVNFSFKRCSVCIDDATSEQQFYLTNLLPTQYPVLQDVAALAVMEVTLLQYVDGI